MGSTAFFVLAAMLEKVERNMDARLYVGNLARSTTQDELTALFAQAGNVSATEVIKDRRTGESKAFAFVTMTGQAEADKAISLFNAYSLGDHTLKVSMAKVEEQHNGNGPLVEPYVRKSMINLHVSTIISRPMKHVFDFVSAPENDFQWQYGTLAAARIPDGVSRLGSFFRSIGHLLGHRMQGIFEVTEYEPNSRYAFRSLSGPLHVQTSYTFEIASESTKITISTQAHAASFFEMNERLIERSMKKQLKENLAHLKALLEAKHPHAAL
jgi:RNA recognition motif-containing protein